MMNCLCANNTDSMENILWLNLDFNVQIISTVLFNELIRSIVIVRPG